MRSVKQSIKNLLPYGLVQKRIARQAAAIQSASKAAPKPLAPQEIPALYNAHGQPMQLFYLQDHYFLHTPYTLTYGRVSDRVFWDRHNDRLPRHFYTGSSAAHVHGAAQHNYAFLCEAEAIVPEDYALFRTSPALARQFDLIFTHNEAFLQSMENARFAPASTVWVGTPQGGGTLDPNAYLHKTKNCSMIASEKQLTENQRIRVEIARTVKRLHLADTFGQFDGGQYFSHVADALTSYRYHIVVENETQGYTFTEKILNCFATMAVPVYYGATRIDEYFNMDGILTLQKGDLNTIDKVLARCTPAWYQERLGAIQDNFRRVQAFLSMEEYLFTNYPQLSDLHA